MLCINKFSTLLALATFLIVPATVTFAKNDNSEKRNQAVSPKVVSVTATPTLVKAKYLNQTIQQIQTSKPKIKNSEIKKSLEEIQNQQSESDEVIDTSFKKIATRSGLIKLIVGPDYKNAGQVRSEIVHLQNQVRTLTRLEEKAPASDQTLLKVSITSLNNDLLAIQTRLNESLKGFSLFGWLNKLLVGFTPEVSVISPTPTVSLSPSIVPTTSIEPSPTP